MEIGMLTGVLVIWILFIGLTVFLYLERFKSDVSEERYVRVEVDPEHYPLKLKDKA